MSMCGERIKITHKNNKHADCPMCEAEEEWEHARMCNENKQKRDEWTQNVQAKFKVTIKKRQAMDYEKKIVEETLKYSEKHFTREENMHANQQLLGIIEVFRGVVVKE